MKHPYTRAERRHERERVIAARRFVWEHVWRNGLTNEWRPEWGRYSKWNLNCGCTRCHFMKYYKEKRKRRESLKQSVLKWEQDW